MRRLWPWLASVAFTGVVGLASANARKPLPPRTWIPAVAVVPFVLALFLLLSALHGRAIAAAVAASLLAAFLLTPVVCAGGVGDPVVQGPAITETRCWTSVGIPAFVRESVAYFPALLGGAVAAALAATVARRARSSPPVGSEDRSP